MADRHREQMSTRLNRALRLTFVLVGISSLTLGYIGLRQFVLHKTNPQFSHAPGDLVYFDAQLFLLQSSPLDQGGPYPAALAVARFMAPCVSVYTVIELWVAFSAGRINSARLRRYRGHAVVCGSTRMAEVLAQRLKESGRRVVVVDAQPVENAPAGRVTGDPRLPQSLKDAGVERAAVVYICLQDSHRNVDVADSVERLRAGRSTPARIHALVTDLDLCLALKARRWSTVGPDVLHLDFFTPDELAAQRVVRQDEEAFADGPPQLAIVGTGAFGRSVLVETARQWLVRGKQPQTPLAAVLVGPDARQAADLLIARYPFLENVCSLRAWTGTLEQLLSERSRAGAPRLRRLYLCQEDEGEALKSALNAVAHLRSAVGSVVVRLDRMSGIAKTFERERRGNALFDALGGRLRVVDVAEEACDPAVIGFDLVEGLARTGHQRYLLERLADGAAMGSAPAMGSWEQLSEGLRISNRAQIMDIGGKLAMIGCTLVPRPAPDQDFCYRQTEIEVLARREHERWSTERVGDGWRYGDRRDDAGKRHPDLVPWTRLSEPSREKDREAVRVLPELLAEVGLAIVRIGSPAV